ncbi:MAG: hypothetical protein ACRD35_09470 [Candidatus Acidiferrales bacterium]
MKVLYFALFATVGLYWVVLEILAPGLEPRDPGIVKTVLQGVAAATAGAVLYLRFSRIASLLDASTPEPPNRLAQLRLYYILCFALSEAVALYGFVLRFLGGTRQETALFFLGSAALFLLCYPRLPTALGDR